LSGGKRNKKGLQREQIWNILQLRNEPRLEGVMMIHVARDFAAFGAMVCFCTTLAVWGDVLLSVG
jgi:hypothetical protein